MNDLNEPLIYKQEESCGTFKIVTFLVFIIGITLIGYQMYTMINLMQKMTLNTFAMCNMTKALATTPSVCYM